MNRLLPILGIAGGLCAAAAALYSASQMPRLADLRSSVAQSARSIDGHVTGLGGQAAAVEERVQALRAVAATPEMPVSGADLQAQIDRLLILRDGALAIAADDAAGVAVAKAAQLSDAAQARIAALATDPMHLEGGLGAIWEGQSAIDQLVHEISLRRAVAESEGPRIAASFDPWDLQLDPAHYQLAGYDADEVAKNLTYSFLSAAEKARWRMALAEAGADDDALQAVLRDLLAALEAGPEK